MQVRIPKRTTFAARKSSSVALVPTRQGGQQALGQPMQKLGAEILERERKARHTVELQTVRERAMREQEDFLRRYPPGAHQQLGSELQRFQRQMTKEILKGVSGDVKAQARGVLQSVWMDGATAADEMRYEYGIEQIKAAAQEHRYETMARAAATSSPHEAMSAIDLYGQTVDALVAQGIYAPSKGQELKESFGDAVMTQRLKEQLITDPHGVVELLQDPEAAPYLTGESRRSILDAAVTAARQKDAREEADREQAEREAEESLGRIQDRTFMALYAGTLDGSTDMADIDRNRQLGLLKPSQYTQLVKVMQSPDAQDDPEVVEYFTRGIMSGEITNPTQIINSVGHGLSPNTASQLVNDLEQGAAVVQSRNFKEARNYLDRQLGVTPGITIGALTGDEQQTVARARRELYERALGGEDPWTVADEMLPRYVSRERGFPEPMYPDEEALMEAFEAGEINETVLDQQLRLLDQTGAKNAGQ